MSNGKVKVGVLGATGTVGQRFILQLSNHPDFELVALGASASSANKPYHEAVAGRWKQVQPIPANVRDMTVHECEPAAFKECGVVFSGLDSTPAGPVEAAFRAANLRVFSNAKNYRRDPLCPLIVPLVNPSHLSILPHQQKSMSPPLDRGYIVTNANCSTTGVVVALKALEDAFGPLDIVMVQTMQAISGSGYPGVSSLDILDNVVPYISGEEEKIEWETSKILGGLKDNDTAFDLHETSPLRVSAHCNRVPVIDGHLACVSVSFKKQPAPSPEQVAEALRAFTCEAQTLGCHSAPKQAITVHDEVDRPQPRLDREWQNGSGVNVGRIRKDPVLDIKFVSLVNNVMLGAATSSVLNAEIALKKGYLS
ncbi:aspartate-semialdehyde dehydrogenase [Malassezia pachydermatis]|uniref:Aspartate-semialdehyde dehydrogenase n=1 Tax=Malassezia pachydermatis TaxID=77020 RepID=A0A0M8MWH4_9BASI|nr:aspartate-semialdehyde dehydrogenase [Malassezia pachydermatis]KOS15704.1 aspartate-semialdehyde dehydrogenase [Malassezia pachydermatis]